MCGDWQAAGHGRLHSLRLRWSIRTFFFRFAFGRFLLIEAEAGSFLAGDLNMPQNGTHGIAYACFSGNSDELTSAGGGDGHHRLVGLHLDDVGIRLHGVAFLMEYADDGGLGDGFAELGHLNGYECHGGSAK